MIGSLLHFGKVAAVLSLMACGACSAPTRGHRASPSVHLAEPNHVGSVEATVQNAGATRCQLSVPMEIGAIVQYGRFAIGFGVRGGLVAWSTSEGIRVRALSLAGAPIGREMNIGLPADAMAVEVAPLGRGFVVIAKRIEYRQATCEGRCVDATCSGWPRDVPQPHVCEYWCPKPCTIPSKHEFVIQYVNIAGQTIGAPIIAETGFIDVEAMLLGDGRSLGFMTRHEIFWIRTNERSSIALTRHDLPQVQYALPVRGTGSPTLLALEEDGAARVIDERGVHAVKGSLIDPRSGRIVDARLQARWDSSGRIHVARQAWLESLDAIHYAVIEGHEVRQVGDVERRGFREPFAEYVEPHYEDGRFRRSSWLQRIIGDDIDLRSRDPRVDAMHARFVWTGRTFLFAYPTLDGAEHTLRAMIADCSAATPSAR